MPVTRKLTKLLQQPRAFWQDAWLKRRFAKELPQLAAAQHALEMGDPATVRSLLEGSTQPQARLLIARCDLQAFNYSAAAAQAAAVMEQIPICSGIYKRAFYLHNEALRQLARTTGDSKAANDVLRLVLNAPFRDTSSLFFRTLRLTCLVANQPEAYRPWLQRYPQGSVIWRRVCSHYILLLRDNGQLEQALSLAHRKNRLIKEQTSEQSYATSTKESPDPAWPAKAALALAQLKEDLDRHDIDFFLISGTLLGCIREGRLLPHDKDLDIGIDERYQPQQVLDALATGGRFRLLEVAGDPDDALYLQHANGVLIDIFRHTLRNGRYEHRGIKCLWWNTPVALRSQPFLGADYLVPENASTYLTENYGDWHTPVIQGYETFLDTPNQEITNQEVMQLYLMSRLDQARIRGDQLMVQRLETALNDYPEPADGLEVF